MNDQSPEEKEIVKNNLIIWKALNIINPGIYSRPINGGLGRATTVDARDLIATWDYLYFHNSWSELMPALLLVKKGKVEVENFQGAYNDLLETCKELTKHLPQTVWFLENRINKQWIPKNFADTYDVRKAGDNEVIPTTSDSLQALKFETSFGADKFLKGAFQFRHLYDKDGFIFEPTEHEFSS